MDLQVDSFLMFVASKQLEYSICINCFVEVSDPLLMVIPSELHMNDLTMVPIIEWPIDSCRLKFSRNYKGFFKMGWE